MVLMGDDNGDDDDDDDEYYDDDNEDDDVAHTPENSSFPIWYQTLHVFFIYMYLLGSRVCGSLDSHARSK